MDPPHLREATSFPQTNTPLHQAAYAAPGAAAAPQSAGLRLPKPQRRQRGSLESQSTRRASAWSPRRWTCQTLRVLPKCKPRNDLPRISIRTGASERLTKGYAKLTAEKNMPRCKPRQSRSSLTTVRKVTEIRSVNPVCGEVTVDAVREVQGESCSRRWKLTPSLDE
jgi:hypothetical protein